ncbi:MAG: hypothetical protein JWR19_2179 [Pedosphaera sp.]|nr:hypothetical protein [Pedosphaera sp.]
MKTLNHILTVHENGDISTLWTEAIPLEAIGTMEINRASTIEFNQAKQEWEVRFSNSEAVVFSDKSRAACLAWEVEQLNGKV